MKCTDCGAGTPTPEWRRCYEHALQAARALMSPVPIAPLKVERQYSRTDRVVVVAEGLLGTVMRVDRKVGNQYVVEMDDGTRRYVPPGELRPAAP